jgi:LacI family transcriptional regulator
MTTLQKIASQLGISTATVSRALNDRPGVRQDTRQRILSLATEMNYSPNMAARSLVSATTGMAGFLFFEGPLALDHDPFYLQVMRGAEQELARKGYFLIISTLQNQDLQSAQLNILREKRVDGLILAGPFFPQRFILSLVTQNVPLVLVDNMLQQTQVNCVLVEDEYGGYAVTRHLLAHGHQKIAMLSGPEEWVSACRRSAGYRRAMGEAGFPCKIITMPETTSQTGYQAMKAALRQDASITAVFTANDVMAFGAMQAAQEHGRSIPQDLAIAGFDDVDAASHSYPALTTVRVPRRLLGVQAARRLIELLENEGESAVTSMVAAELVLRNSCGCKGTDQN